jgi:hypothetical protein
MTSATITPAEFEKALARACMKAANQYLGVEPFRCGDASAVLCGAKLADIAREAGLSIPQTRRRMRLLRDQGKVITDETSGSWTRWWLVGLAAQAPARQVIPTACNWTAQPSATSLQATPSPATTRQGVTAPAALPVREPWWKVLGVARDCSTSEVRQAFKDCMDGVPEYDLDAEQQRQRIRDAYNTRLTEDGISEYE